MTKEEKYKKYIEEINKIEKDFISDRDNEYYHQGWDLLVQEILEENGYENIAKMYNEASDNFWYA